MLGILTKWEFAARFTEQTQLAVERVQYTWVLIIAGG